MGERGDEASNQMVSNKDFKEQPQLLLMSTHPEQKEEMMVR